MTSSNTPAPPASPLYRGVRLEPGGGLWAAYISAGDHAGRLIGHFERDYTAALAHDRVALFLGGADDASAINFPPSFSAMERLFLRRRCTEEFVLRAVLDHTYDVEFEDFLRAAFDECWWGAGDEEAARAVAGCVARVAETPLWRRAAADEAAASHAFVMGHLNPVLCGSWVPYFHHQGDPNRSFFTCEEAHQWEAARRAAEREEAAQRALPGDLEATIAPAPAQEQVRAPEPGDPALGRAEAEEQEQRASHPSSRAMPPRRASTAFRSFKRWLRRTCFFGEQSEREQQLPLLKTSRGHGRRCCRASFDVKPSRRQLQCTSSTFAVVPFSNFVSLSQSQRESM